ncbi:MAG: MarR family transcriptional regulator [Micromonosporaceae bacterium]|nr:MarR family transcriptional regulator [Micromonosporaceae bacterium]
MTARPQTARPQTVGASALRASLDIRVVVSRLRRRLMEVTDAEDITPAQASVLMRLGKGDVSTASALATAEHVRPQSMAVTLSTLEQLGLISRTPDPTDGRRQIIELTAAGRRRVAGAKRAGAEWLATSLQTQFTEAERQTVIAAMGLLERLVS